MEEMKTLTMGGKTYKVVDEDAVRSYYSTTREDLSVTLGKEGAVPSDVTTNVVWGLYDALVAKYPDRVQKNEIHNNDGSFTNYEYVISTGAYNPETGLPDSWVMDNDIKKPAYLVLSGIHGNERQAVVSTYRFIRDVVAGYNIPEQFREGCEIRVVPVGNPYSFDARNDKGEPSRYNENGVDINRDFYSETPQKETQALQNWLNANKDAKLFLDMHNGRPFAAVVFAGLTDFEADKPLKKVAMRGVERVIPFWRNVIGYDDDVVFYMATSLHCTGTNEGLSYNYAFRECGIPSLGVELAFRQNISEKDALNPDGSIKIDQYEITDETPAASAEIIGNVLIEFYEQYFMSEVVDMTETNAKLDELLKRTSFRIETGVYTVPEDLSGSQTVRVPCTSGAKMLNFFPDEGTLNSILQYSDKTADEGGNNCFVSFSGQTVEKFSIRTLAPAYRGYQLMVKQLLTSNGPEPTFRVNDHAASCDNTDGFTFTAVNLKNGTYNWTAYYWDE